MSTWPNHTTSVLIADRNAHMRRIVRYMVMSLKIKDIYEAQDGSEALEYYEAFQPNFLICDWELPIMSGLEVWDLIRMNSAHRPAFIMMGDHSKRDNINQLAKAGIRAYLRKPFSTKDLAARMVTLTGKQQVRASA